MTTTTWHDHRFGEVDRGLVRQLFPAGESVEVFVKASVRTCVATEARLGKIG